MAAPYRMSNDYCQSWTLFMNALADLIPFNGKITTLDRQKPEASAAGVRLLAEAMRMLKAQVDRPPAPQWVCVVGGFTEHQFAEKRLPTLDEINAVSPDTPVFILHLPV